ncbi:SDR family NAD(P)-dependent oxidoreductase [Sphingobium lactosutens]|uniref:SDR family NAD(P)-dependent oxidoreductase n=1 Tax=Sphingobium lactosutens TaxID=522773 RepID=UPI0015BB4CF5
MDEHLNLNGRVAIVTGAGRGLGRAYAMELASLGCKLVVNDLGTAADGSGANAGSAQATVDDIIAAGGQATAHRGNAVTQASEIVEAAIDAFGRLDILINNAGAVSGALFEASSAEEWHGLFDIHLRSTVGMCRAAWQHLRRSDAAKIVNIASNGMMGNKWLTSYSAAKGAIFGFSRSLALEAADLGIAVNCIMPIAWTRMSDGIEDPRISRIMERDFQPERVAAFVAWLVHPETRVNNELFEVGGGHATRIAFAMRPFVHARDDSAGAWQAVAEDLMSPGPLTPVTSAYDMLVREIVASSPDTVFDEGVTVENSMFR